MAKQALDNSTGEPADLLVYLSDVPGVVVGEVRSPFPLFSSSFV